MLNPQLHLLLNHQWAGDLDQTDQLCQHFLMLHNWLHTLDNGKEVCAVFFDLRKAIDSVPQWSL